MDINKYIASGILEAYVLGDLTLAEKQEVDAMIETYPALKAELEDIEITIESFAQVTGVAPKLSFDDITKANVSQFTIQSAHNNPSTKSDLIQTEAPQRNLSEMELVKARNKALKLQRIAIAASLTALITSGAALLFYTKYQQTDKELEALQAEKKELTDNYIIVKDKLTYIASEMDMVNDRNAERIVLATTVSDNPTSSANLYWNHTTDEVYLSIQHLEELADHQQYQLWAIIDGKPVDAGTFDWNASGLTKMESFDDQVEMFAVTIEQRGGSTSPSLETMQVSGSPEPRKG